MSLISLIKYSDDDVIVLSKIKYQIKRKPSLLDDYDDEGWYPLHHAVQLDYVNSVRMLLSMGAESNVFDHKYMTPLHIAINSNNNLAIIKILLDFGANPNIFDHRFCTPLHTTVLSISSNTYQIVKMLIDAGVNINALEECGLTALNIMARYSINNEDIMQLLIDKGVDVNLKDISGNTPLHTAIWSYFIDSYFSRYSGEELLARKYYNSIKAYENCRTGSLSAIELLIKVADVNLQDEIGNTPLHLLLHFDEAVIFKLVNSLIAFGADINLKNNNGETALCVLTRNLSECGNTFVCLEEEEDKEDDILIVPAKYVVDSWTTWSNVDIVPKVQDQRMINLLINNGANLDVKNDGGNRPGYYLRTFMDDYLSRKVKKIFDDKSVVVFDGECCICMNDVGFVNCSFSHGYCSECLLELGTLHCSMCGSSLIYRKAS